MFSASFARLFILASLVASSFAGVVPTFHVHDRRDSHPSTFTKVGAAPSDKMITMRINLAMGDRDGLEDALMQASTPGSPTFRQWLSKEQVEAFAKPSAETTQAVAEWLKANDITASPTTPAGDWITFDVPVSKANTLLNANYALYRHTDSGAQSVRTLEYSIPANLVGKIKAVHPTTSFSGPLKSAPVVSVAPPVLESDGSEASACSGSTITPACLASLYSLPTTPITGSASTVAVSAFDEQNANNADLKKFLQQFRPDLSASTTFNVTLIDGATNSQTGSQAGVEANLDIQYVVGLVNGIPASFVDVGDNTKDGDDDGFLDIINALIAESKPPLVLSTSYGFDTEASLSESLTLAMCDQYMQLTSRGVSITFASGDGGVASTPGVSCNGKPFPPTFPTCPFATLVGATSGVPEKGASLSAGGFSNYFAQPSWQTSAVSSYLAELGTTNQGRYNASGRAYPDVSAQGQNVQVIVNGRVTSVAGTSCSSPIFSSVIALVNDKLLAAGKPPLGFLNPFLYANPQAFNDVTSGSNPGCGTQGFPALAGWDPVTGLGTPNFNALLQAALAA